MHGPSGAGERKKHQSPGLPRRAEELGRRRGHRQQRQVPGFRLCPLLESSTSTQGPGKLCTHPPLLPGLGI